MRTTPCCRSRAPRSRTSLSAPAGDGPGSFGPHRDLAPEVRAENVDVIEGTLDHEIIRRVVQWHASQVRYCYERELITRPGLEEKIVVTWMIDANGVVHAA